LRTETRRWSEGKTNNKEIMELRIKFSSEIVISGDNINEIRQKWESMPLFSEEAEDNGAEFCEVLLVDDEDYNDLTSEFEYGEDDDEDETPYDVNGVKLCVNDIVEWTDPETGRKVKYEVYEEPSSEMVKLCSKYGECEAFPCECRIIGHKGKKGTMSPEEYVDYLYYIYRTNGEDREYTDLYAITRGNTQMLKKGYRDILDETLVDDIVLTLRDKINGNC